MYEVIMKSKHLIKPHEDSQTRTSSRFQQLFDKMAGNSDDQSRKWTDNSNHASYDENAAEDEDGHDE